MPDRNLLMNFRSLSDLRLTARFLPFFPAAALPKYSRSPATLRFCRLASGKNHQKSPRRLKVRQTPGSLSDLRLTVRFLPFFPAAALPKCSRSPATLRFCRLASGKNHQKSPRRLKVRQTPGSLQISGRFSPCVYILMAVLISCGTPLSTQEIIVGGHTLSVDIADTQELRSKGLMNRRSLPDNKGMLFVFESESKPSFWMKDTTIPLSIAFIAANGMIRQIDRLEPLSLESVVSRRTVLYALEVNRGWFEERNITPGDMVQFQESLRR